MFPTTKARKKPGDPPHHSATRSDSKTSAPEAAVETGAKYADISGLPVELLVSIMTYLDGREISRCTRVSRTFRNVIENAAALQYKIECFLAGVISNPSIAVGLNERLDRLRQWREACKKLQWTAHSYSDIPDREWTALDSFDNVHCEQHDNAITIMQPSSKFKGRTAKEWTFDLGFQPLRFFCDSYQHLLVLIGFDETLRKWTIHLSSSETGEPHSLASSSTLYMSNPDEYDNDESNQFSIRVFDNMLAIIRTLKPTEEDGTATQANIYDWKAGTIIFEVYGNSLDRSEPSYIAFLDRDHFAMPVMSRVGDLQVNSVAIFRVRDDFPGMRPFTQAVLDASFALELPKATGVTFDKTILSCQPPPTETAPDDECIFRRDPSAQTTPLVIAPIVSRPSVNQQKRHVNIVIAIRIQDLWRAARATTTGASPIFSIPWSKWSAYSRVFDFPYQVDYNSSRLVHAPLLKIGPNYRLSFDIYDLDTPYAITKDLSSADEADHLDIITSETEILHGSPDLWSDTVHTSMPYRLIPTGIPDITSEDGVSLGEDYIVIIRNITSSLYTTREVYSI